MILKKQKLLLKKGTKRMIIIQAQKRRRGK